MEDDDIALKLRKREMRRAETEAAAAKKKAEADRKAIEYKRYVKEVTSTLIELYFSGLLDACCIPS